MLLTVTTTYACETLIWFVLPLSFLWVLNILAVLWPISPFLPNRFLQNLCVTCNDGKVVRGFSRNNRASILFSFSLQVWCLVQLSCAGTRTPQLSNSTFLIVHDCPMLKASIRNVCPFLAFLKGLPSTAGGPLVDSNRTRFGATSFPRCFAYVFTEAEASCALWSQHLKPRTSETRGSLCFVGPAIKKDRGASFGHPLTCWIFIKRLTQVFW